MDLGGADRKAVVIGTAVASLILGQQAAMRVVRDALFLSAYPAALLPVAMMAASIATMASVAVMSRLLARHAPSKVLPWVTAAASVCLLLEWALNAAAPGIVAIVIYLHFSVFGGVVISGFWS